MFIGHRETAVGVGRLYRAGRCDEGAIPSEFTPYASAISFVLCTYRDFRPLFGERYLLLIAKGKYFRTFYIVEFIVDRDITTGAA